MARCSVADNPVVGTGSGNTNGILRWMAARTAGRESARPLLSQRCRDEGAPIAALRHIVSVAKAPHQFAPSPGAFQPRSAGLSENAKPGNEGATTWKASSAWPPWAAGFVKGPMILKNSITEPGQPCVTMIRLSRADV